MMNKELPKVNLKVSNKMYYIIHNQCPIIICSLMLINCYLFVSYRLIYKTGTLFLL